MLADPDILGNLAKQCFDPGYWAARGELTDVTRGRGAAWFVGAEGRPWVLRHFRRGGLIAKLSKDRYVWAGERRVRAFVEWRLLAVLKSRGLPVPQPIAARYERTGWTYRCDLIIQRIVDAEPLSGLLARGPLDETSWRRLGALVASFHAAGADHADLNAHNVLIDGAGAISLIDFDRGRLRPRGAWTAANLARLRRSLRKVARGLPAGRFTAAAWECFMAGYASGVVDDATG